MKKKLKQSGSDEGVDQEGHSSSSSSNSHPKGQWERRLQTDIQMAKKALCDALSLHKPATATATNLVVPDDATKPSSTSHQPYKHASSSYASSYENISRLMENWMKSPNSNSTNNSPGYYSSSFSNMVNNNTTTGSSSSEGAHSNTTTTTQDQGFDSLLTLNSSKHHGSSSQTQVPLTLLENWLFDDGAAQCHEDLMNMSLEESTAGLF